jgi:hypothetical protein
VQLDGLEVDYAVSWPKAIHEGSGTLKLFVTKHSHQNQKNDIVNMFTGKAKGDGPFALFVTTFKYILDLQFVEINAKIDGTKNSFSIPGIMGVQLENFVNPVTGMNNIQKYNCLKDSFGKFRCSKNKSDENTNT